MLYLSLFLFSIVLFSCTAIFIKMASLGYFNQFQSRVDSHQTLPVIRGNPEVMIDNKMGVVSVDNEIIHGAMSRVFSTDSLSINRSKKI